MAKQPVDKKPVEEEQLPTVVPGALPAFMQGKTGVGTEDISMDDIETPRILIIQSADTDRVQTFDVKPGVFFHNTLEEDIGTQLTIVPVAITKRAVLWRPRPPIDQGGILARSDDLQSWRPSNTKFSVRVDKQGRMVEWDTKGSVRESGLLEWGSFDPQDKNSQPAATLVYDLAFVVVEPKEHAQLGVCAVSLQRSAVKVARKLMGRMKLSNAPIYGQRFIMKVVTEQGQGQTFFNYAFQADGLVQDEALYRKLEDTYNAIKGTGFKVKDEEGLQAEGAAMGADSGEGKPAF